EQDRAPELAMAWMQSPSTISCNEIGLGRRRVSSSSMGLNSCASAHCLCPSRLGHGRRLMAGYDVNYDRGLVLPQTKSPLHIALELGSRESQLLIDSLEYPGHILLGVFIGVGVRAVRQDPALL